MQGARDVLQGLRGTAGMRVTLSKWQSPKLKLWTLRQGGERKFSNPGEQKAKDIFYIKNYVCG